VFEVNCEDSLKLRKKLELIEDEKIKNFVSECLNIAPKYFWEIAASASGKYHPESSLGKGGLIRHTVLTINYGIELCEKNVINGLEKDKIIASLILHDTCKAGVKEIKNNAHYRYHAYLPKKYYKKISHLCSLNVFDEIFLMVDSHMGEWSTFKEKIPRTKLQKIVHYADYLASRKNQPITDFNKELQSLKTYDNSIIL
jgi:hypothetical protein